MSTLSELEYYCREYIGKYEKEDLNYGICNF